MTRENKTSRSCSPNLQEILAQLWQQAVCIRICHTTDSAQSKLFASHSMKVIAICIRGYLLFGPKRNCASHRAQLPSRALMCAETFFTTRKARERCCKNSLAPLVILVQATAVPFLFFQVLSHLQTGAQAMGSTSRVDKTLDKGFRMAPSSLSQGHKRPHRRKDPRILSLPFVWSIGFLCFCAWAESSPATLG